MRTLHRSSPWHIAWLFITSIVFSPHVLAAQSAVAMPDTYSAKAAEQVLLEGGNAVDAAVAAGFVLAVTYPEAGNIGGGGFMTLYHEQKPYFLDYRETAPQGATRDMYLDKDGNVIPNLSIAGGQAAGVPGTVQGFWLAHQRFGKLPWKRLLQPAIDLAHHGFIVHEQMTGRIKDKIPFYQNKPNTNFLAHFAHLKTGDRFKQAELALTLTRIAEHGSKDFYHGRTADLLVEHMRQHGGLITKDDLANYRALWRPAMLQPWQSYQIISAPPPSSGGVALLQLLTLKSITQPLFAAKSLNSPTYIHLLAELEKRVYADRAEYLGDPDFVNVPIEKLLETRYLKRRAQGVNPTQISVTEDIKPGLDESPQTTHYSIIDRWGNAVSNTYTLNLNFGNGVVVDGAGFLLNNEMDDFSAKPGVPNAFGVVGGTANAIAANKRMLSSMTPSILLEGDQVRMVVGSPGGSTIITSVFQAIVNHIEFGLTANQTVNQTRYHHQLLPKNEISHSKPISAKQKQGLEALGYRTKYLKIGDLQVVTRINGQLDAASDQIGRGHSLIIEHIDE